MMEIPTETSISLSLLRNVLSEMNELIETITGVVVSGGKSGHVGDGVALEGSRLNQRPRR